MRMQLPLIVAFLAPLPVSPERTCGYLASPRNTEKILREGNVSGFIQQCNRTDCCMGVYRLEDGGAQPDLLGCSVTGEPCPKISCHASVRYQNYISCTCRSDFCNLNISWNHQTTQSQHPHSSELRRVDVPIIILAVALVVMVFVFITVLKLFLKGCRSVTALYTCPTSKESDTHLEDLELQKMQVVAQGHFACVWQGSFQGSLVAIKVFPHTLKAEFRREKGFYMLPLMKHSGIVRFLTAGRMKKQFVLLLELASQGSLNAFLSGAVCDWAATVKLAQTLSQALAYLHTDLTQNGVYKPAIAHCDLSSNNVLVKADGSCALCDFGCSKVVRGFRKVLGHTARTEGRIRMGTLQYMAPEILEGSANLSSDRCLLQGDIYSLGLLLWELFMRCSDLCTDSDRVPDHTLPYETELGGSPSLQELLGFVSELRRRPALPQHWHRVCQALSLQELLEDCWDHDPDARLTAHCAANRLASLSQAALVLSATCQHLETD